MKLKKILALIFLIGAFFAVNNLGVQANDIECFNNPDGDGPCCIGSGGICPQAGRECCKGFTCKEAFPGAGTTCIKK